MVDGLIGHWPLTEDTDDHGPYRLETRAENVALGERGEDGRPGARFDGRTSRLRGCGSRCAAVRHGRRDIRGMDRNGRAVRRRRRRPDQQVRPVDPARYPPRDRHERRRKHRLAVQLPQPPFRDRRRSDRYGLDEPRGARQCRLDHEPDRLERSSLRRHIRAGRRRAGPALAIRRRTSNGPILATPLAATRSPRSRSTTASSTWERAGTTRSAR